MAADRIWIIHWALLIQGLGETPLVLVQMEELLLLILFSPFLKGEMWVLQLLLQLEHFMLTGLPLSLGPEKGELQLPLLSAVQQQGQEQTLWEQILPLMHLMGQDPEV